MNRVPFPPGERRKPSSGRLLRAAEGKHRGGVLRRRKPLRRLHAGDQLKMPGEIIRRHFLLGVLPRRTDDARVRQIKLG